MGFRWANEDHAGSTKESFGRRWGRPDEGPSGLWGETTTVRRRRSGLIAAAVVLALVATYASVRSSEPPAASASRGFAAPAPSGPGGGTSAPTGAPTSADVTTTGPAEAQLSPGEVAVTTAPPGPPAAVASPPADQPIAPPPAEFEEVPAPAEPPPSALRNPAGTASGTGLWAVIIGINDYPGSRNDLRYALNDANDVNEALARFGVPGDHRLLIRNGQATAGVVLAAADWLVSHAGPQSTAVFFYAGHVRKASKSTEVIVGADGRTVTDAELAQHLAGLQARRTWLAIAACYGGGFSEALGPGRILTAAADADHLAYENSTYGRSYLVQFMVRQAMIEGAAPSSVQASFAYAKSQIDQRYRGRSPVQYDAAGDPVDLRQQLVRAAPPPSSGGSGGGSTGGSPSPTTTAPPNGCRSLTLGIVTCNSGA